MMSVPPPAAPALDYIRRGSGEPLVLLHGIGGELCVWEPVIPALGEVREVIAIDLPGFGASPALVDVEPRPAALAAAVAPRRQIGERGRRPPGTTDAPERRSSTGAAPHSSHVFGGRLLDLSRSQRDELR